MKYRVRITPSADEDLRATMVVAQQDVDPNQFS